MRQSVILLCFFALGVFPQCVFGQVESEEDFPPGLLGQYTASGKTIERIDSSVAFDWGKASPDARLPEGVFSAQWNGVLLVRQAGTYQLSAFLQGEVDVEFDGHTVLQGQSQTAGWITGKPFELRFGDQPLRIRFRKTQPSAMVRLFWSSDSFPLEPLPALLIFREEAQPHLKAVETGRTLFAAARCNRCHLRESDELAPTAPALTHVRESMDWNWLVSKITISQTSSPGTQMPNFGFKAEEVQQIAAFLVESSQSAKLDAVKSKEETKDLRQGEILFRSVGCLACHTLENEGQSGPFGGGNLDYVGFKRSRDWLSTWLKSPEKLNADHRMPTVKLTDEERRQLAVFLSDLGKGTIPPNKPPKFSKDTLEAGKKLVEASGCAACHRIPNIKSIPQNLTDLSKPIQDWDNSCLSEKTDPSKHRPGYTYLEAAKKDAIKKYINSLQGTVSKASDFARGQWLLEQKNCLSCHERNHAKGIVETAGKAARMDKALEGQSEALIPPALNAVGDKLLDVALEETISGEQPKPRLPWLKVRMPRFKHSDSEKAAILAYLKSEDRIPDAAPIGQVQKSKTDTADALVAGHTLIGAKGFSCVACHRVGSFEPRNVALGTRGSDLLMLGQRMRKSYYLRWTLSPQRIVPGMEMPSVRKAVPGVLNENLTAQLIATWDALNDPRFTAPTAPSAVEQLLVTQPGEPARIVRDVFTNSKENGGDYVARAMAIGFNNGHNILLDLDNFTLLNWTFGDFARQRTEGKSWYWDLAGVPVMNGFTNESDFALEKSDQPESAMILPTKDQNAAGRLLSYATEGDLLKLEYQLRFDLKGREHFVNISEMIRPTSTGWSRELSFRNVPEGYEMLVATNRRTALVGNPQIEVKGQTNSQSSDVVRAENGGIRLVYSSNLTRPDLELPPVPEVVTKLEPITSVPGYEGRRLELPSSIMPTSLAWTDRELPGIPQGTLVFTSLKGHLLIARDTDGDGFEDALSTYEEGLAAPYGVFPYERGFLVAHKPEVIYLEDTNGDGRADVRRVVATGWGYSDNYHDWTTSLVRDSKGRFYTGLGSDYAQPNRSIETSRWRGSVLRLTPTPFPENARTELIPWSVTPVAHGFRYPTGIAITDNDEIFVTDNQGVQNTFNELNHLVEGRHFGVPSRHETDQKAMAYLPAIQIPHPWSRSVNGLFFLPQSGMGHAVFRGQGIGCEYDTRFLVRFSLQKVAGEYQGAAYYFSRPTSEAGGENFLGPLCGGMAPNGDLYIGNIHDSGWLGGRNTGDIVRLTPKVDLLSNGIREVRATAKGFDVEFIKPLDSKAATNPEHYDISGYTREWQGSYATPDSARHKLTVQSAQWLPDGQTVSLIVKDRREGFVYEISCGGLSQFTSKPLFPETAHYTLHRIPKPN